MPLAKNGINPRRRPLAVDRPDDGDPLRGSDVEGRRECPLGLHEVQLALDRGIVGGYVAAAHGMSLTRWSARVKTSARHGFIQCGQPPDTGRVIQKQSTGKQGYVSPMVRRSTHEPLQPSPRPRWLVVRDMHGTALECRPLAPMSDLHGAFVKAMASQVGAGWQFEVFTSPRATAFYHRGAERRVITIESDDPARPTPSRRHEFPDFRG